MEGRFSKLEKESAPVAPAAGRESVSATDTANRLDAYAQFLSKADEELFLGNYQDALRNYSRALQMENAQVYPWIGQISALVGMKNYKEAELWSNRALEQFPEDTSLLSQRARVLALTGNIKRAIGVSDYALQKGATQWTWMARGEVLLEAGDKNALFCFEKALELSGPEDWRAPLIAGLAFVRRRQWANAEEFLKRSVGINSRNYFAWYELGKVLIELSYMDRARDAVERVLQLKPDFRAARELEERIYRQPFYKRMLGVFRRKG